MVLLTTLVDATNIAIFLSTDMTSG